MAWSIDFLIRIALYVLVSMLLRLLGEFGMGVFLIFVFLIEWFYPVLFEVYWQGATPGKRKMNIMVVHDDSTPVAWSASLLRNLLRAVDILPFLYGFGLVSMLANQRFKRLGDMGAGTLVVYRENRVPYQAVESVDALAPKMAFSLDEQHAILNFAERGRKLSDERQVELADILGPVTGVTGTEGVRRLHQYANWLQGGA